MWKSTAYFCLLVVLWLAVVAVAQEGPQAEPPATATAKSEDADIIAEPDPATLGEPGDLTADPRSQQIAALIAGTLDVGVEPQSLFDVPLLDEAALQIEAARIRALLRALDSPSVVQAAGREGEDGAGAPTARAPKGGAAAGKTGAPSPSGTGTAEEVKVQDALWSARIALDRARLRFYALEREARLERLQRHTERQAAARPQESEEEQRRRADEAERKRALEAARLARTEAERLVGAELARLIDLEKQVDAVKASFQSQRKEQEARKDLVLGWQRRVREVDVARSQADATYTALRRALQSARDELNTQLSRLGARRSRVPALWPDPLVDVPPDVPQEKVRQKREAVAEYIENTQAFEREIQEERARSLLEEIDALNEQRLKLLPMLSSRQRAAITGFTEAGVDQARSEARHLILILRTHRHVVMEWLRAVRQGVWTQGWLWKSSTLIVGWSMVLLVFLWLRRRSPALVRLATQRIAEADRAERRVYPSLTLRIARLVAQVHRPLEWWLFYLACLSLLPEVSRQVLEVELLVSTVGWILGGMLAVSTVNAFAAGSSRSPFVRREDPQEALRLRSLQLVSRTIITFALFLVLGSRLVGKGTIYSWVWSTCWFAAVPIFLLLVQWWRPTVFDRLEGLRGKTRFHNWLLANRVGWKSPLSAMLAAVDLFFRGAGKLLRSWSSRFDLVRLAHAYLYKRELDRLSEGGALRVRRPLPEDVRQSLHPETRSTALLPCSADEHAGRLRTRIASGQGGLFALIGAQGMGKTTLLEQLVSEVSHGQLVDAAQTPTLKASLLAVLSNQADGSTPRLVVVDNSDTLVKPLIGGLSSFDEALALARAHSNHTVWVFAMDAILWPFVQRMRDDGPLFDELFVIPPWDEGQIGALLAHRCEQAGIAPSYIDLLEKPPPGADQHGFEEALQEREAGYIRMLWSHVAGNPGMALEVWRNSLAVDQDNEIKVQRLKTPNGASLDSLPDATLFILRAVLFLGADATVKEIAAVASLSEAQVRAACQYGQSQGYFQERNGAMYVTWQWLRTVIRLLERRHLLAKP